MKKNLLSVYKLPLLISLVLAMALMAMKTARYPIDIAAIIGGSFLGLLVLDLEYVIYVYVLEPDSDFAKTFLGFIKHRDFFNALSYINYNKDEIKDKSLNSAIFQMVMAPLCILIIYASDTVFVKAIALSIFANSIYRLAECYFAGRTDEWFWVFKTKPDRSKVVMYMLGMVVVLAFCIINFR
jgi:hypothetical protein